MVYALLAEVKNRSGLDPALVEDIALGNVRPATTTGLARRSPRGVVGVGW